MFFKVNTLGEDAFLEDVKQLLEEILGGLKCFHSGFDALFSILFPLVFLVVLGMILFTVVSNLRTWGKN